MQFEERHDDVEMSAADRELEAALRSLSPKRTTDVDPIAAAFAAGRQSARTQVRLWQFAAAAVLMIAIGSWLIPPGADRGSRVVVATAPETIATATSAPVVSPPSGHSMLMLQQAVRERGVDGLPETELPTIRNLRVADFF